ncbi:MAG TPA: 50S ribosomal protein L21 [Firmicutes bacterium]|nr:50S ribosomal protein L21 [Bacillota bacterium]
MYAVFETGGKQYRAQVGDELFVERLNAAEGEQVSFERVLLVSDDNETKIGAPVLEGASVKASVLEHGKGPKILVFKYKAKVNHRRRKGHRQPYTKVRVEAIEA